MRGVVLYYHWYRFRLFAQERSVAEEVTHLAGMLALGAILFLAEASLFACALAKRAQTPTALPAGR